MCNEHEHHHTASSETRTIPVEESVGMVLAHDVTEIRKDEFKGRAFKKGHVIRKREDREEGTCRAGAWGTLPPLQGMRLPGLSFWQVTC